jgi:RNA polymerase sigma factor (sigma-70 family)
MVPPTHRPEDRLLLQAIEHEGLLRTCLHRYARNPSDVEDLLQETYARLLAAGTTEQVAVQSVRAFALAIARNVALDWLRRRQVVSIELIGDLEKLQVLDEEGQIEEIVNADQEVALLREAISRLPKKSRRVFMLRKLHDLSHKEIAARLKISPNTVEQHLRKAAQRCTQILCRAPIFERRHPWTAHARTKPKP